jgi:hypothetical protein
LEAKRKEHRDLAFLKTMYWDAMLQDENFLPFLELESPPTLSTSFTKIVKLACLVATTLPCSYGVHPQQSPWPQALPDGLY